MGHPKDLGLRPPEMEGFVAVLVVYGKKDSK